MALVMLDTHRWTHQPKLRMEFMTSKRDWRWDHDPNDGESEEADGSK